MTFDDAADIPVGTTLGADVCVVGSGAAGITLARQLDGSGRSVIVLEAGGLEDDSATEAHAFAITHHGIPYRSQNPSRGRRFGGSTNYWFGRIATLDPIDFERRPWVPHSGWPIDDHELRPWLRVAADVLDVPNFDRIAIESWEPNPTTRAFIDRGGADLAVFLWANGLLMGQRSRDALRRSSNLRLVLNATATALNLNEPSSAVESLSVRGPHGSTFDVHAAMYVLAAGGLENPRLLMASTLRSAAGVGNEYDNVGRYYMDHPRGEGLAGADLRGLSTSTVNSLALLGEKARTPYGKAQLRVTFPAQMQRDEQLLNHSIHAHLVSDIHHARSYVAARRLVGRVRGRPIESDRGRASDVRDLVAGSYELAQLGARRLRNRDERLGELVIIDQMEQEPDPSSRVTVDHRDRDQFGLPRLHLDWRITAATFRSQRRMHQMFRSIVERAGIHTFWSSVTEDADDVEILDMKHPSGTTRMSASPRTGVVDANCRVHGVENLYIAGSSVFPTVGHANPTLTIVALAARLAHHLRCSEPGRSLRI